MSDAAAAPAKKVSKPKTKKAAPTHPVYKDMILAAIAALKDRKGSSRQAILKYILANYKGVGVEKQVNSRLKLALVRMADAGDLKHVKGKGASGSFRAAEKAKAAPKKKAVAKKPKAKTPKKVAAKKPKAKKAPAAKKPAAKKAKSPKKVKKAKKAKKADKPAAAPVAVAAAKKPAAKKSSKKSKAKKSKAKK